MNVSRPNGQIACLLRVRGGLATQSGLFLQKQMCTANSHNADSRFYLSTV